jgi:hypothetical protein
MSYFIGKEPKDILGDNKRYFYGLRRTDDGELFIGKVDQLLGISGIAVNKPGDPDDNFLEFEPNVDYFEGREPDHTLKHENINYEQYRWDDRNIFYFINEEGELVARVNQEYTYDDTVSSDGIGF